MRARRRAHGAQHRIAWRAVRSPAPRTQALDEAIFEQAGDELHAGRADVCSLALTPLSVMGEEGLGLRRQMITYGAALAGILAARMRHGTVT